MAADQLFQEGVVVIEDPFFAANIGTLRQEFEAALVSFPEYQQHPLLNQLNKDQTYVLGGFSALNNPASFHNPFVRKLREWCMASLIEHLFRDFCAQHLDDTYQLEHIIDRMLARPPKLSPSAESWHRDEAPLAAASDLTFGGWINLDKDDQFFSCVKGTHKAQRGKNGFGKISKSEGEAFQKRKTSVRIPPGGMIVFFEHIVHEVVATKKSHPSIRLFLGWRFTKSHTPLIAGLDALLQNQSVMPLKSGQIPPMSAKLHWTNWRPILEKWSRGMMQPQCLEEKRVESGTKKGDKHLVVHQHMRSLAEYGFPLYHKYSPPEIRMLKPHRTFSLLVPGKSRLRRQVSL